jgi:hypothetical protein
MTKPKEKQSAKPASMPTAADIMAQDDRPTFTVEVPEWGLVGENAAVVRQPDTLTIAKIQESCPDTAHGRCMRAAKLIVEGCVSPKFGPEHLEALATAKNPNAIGRLVAAIMLGHKKKSDMIP